MTGHLVGFTNIDDKGLEGLELAFDYWLAGESGAKRVLKDRLGRAVENVESIRPPHHGKELRTSIDLRIQYVAYRALKSAIQANNAESGSIVVLDTKTGEVLAMANQPSTTRMIARSLLRSAIAIGQLRIFSSLAPAFKPLIVAAAHWKVATIAPAVLSTRHQVTCTVGAKTIEDSRNLGRISLTTILARSSNVGITKVAMSLQPHDLWGTLIHFGLGSLTGSGFPGESAGTLTHHDHWKPVGQATMSYGYALSVTPLATGSGLRNHRQ